MPVTLKHQPIGAAHLLTSAKYDCRLLNIDIVLGHLFQKGNNFS
jgi:hypothetical protein